jgi:hypothetical protein
MANKPPQLKSNIVVRHTYRFTSTSATATAITPTSLLGAAGTVCNTGNTAVACIFQSVKVNKLRMWAPPPAQGSVATCSVEWIGSVASQISNLEVSDSSNSTATPAIVSCRPPRQSLASFWQQPGTNTLFTLTAPVGTIIDVSLSLIMQDDDVGVPGIGIATGTSGLIYFLSLDPNATHHYVPVSLTTTT